MKFFLVGPIQYVDDYMTWRKEIAQFLESMGHEVLILKEKERYIEKKFRYEHFLHLMTREEFISKVREDMERALQYDVSRLLRADAILVYLPKNIKTAGSYGEQTLAYYLNLWDRKNIKIFVVTDVPLEDMSYWVIACSDRIFQSFEEFKQLIKQQAKIYKER